MSLFADIFDMPTLLQVFYSYFNLQLYHELFASVYHEA